MKYAFYNFFSRFTRKWATRQKHDATFFVLFCYMHVRKVIRSYSILDGLWLQVTGKISKGTFFQEPKLFF